MKISLCLSILLATIYHMPMQGMHLTTALKTLAAATRPQRALFAAMRAQSTTPPLQEAQANTDDQDAVKKELAALVKEMADKNKQNKRTTLEVLSIMTLAGGIAVTCDNPFLGLPFVAIGGLAVYRTFKNDFKS